MPRRLLIRVSFSVVVALLGAVLFTAYRLWTKLDGRPDSEAAPVVAPPPFGSKSFEELYAEELAAGWEVLSPLDIPGPYLTKADEIVFWVEPELKNGVVLRGEDRYAWDEKIPKGHLGLPMTAATVDGKTAHGLLVRKMP